MIELPLHDAQIIYMGVNPISSGMEFLLHRCSNSGQYFVVNIRIRGVKSIEAIDGKDINDLFDSGGGVYRASIDTISDFEVLDISGPEYWRLVIKADKINYEEQPVLEEEVDKLLTKSLGIDLT